MITSGKMVAKGLLTYVPGLLRIGGKKGTDTDDPAKYSYGVWMKHLALLWHHGVRKMPDTVAELGPGDSLGVGLAALLSGVRNYYALDVVRHSDPTTNLRVFDELVDLFRQKTARPHKGWPDFDAYLDENLFPSHILTNELLDGCLAPSRIAFLRDAVAHCAQADAGMPIRYRVPWNDTRVIEAGSVDLIISHSVLEHVVDLESTYAACGAWLKPDGVMSHQIDFESHGVAKQWNGYRAYPEFMWKMIVGNRPFLLNREPYSVHCEMLRSNGFDIMAKLQNHRTDGIRRTQLASRWSQISDEDLTCATAFIQACKRDRRR
jgi:hypothetical protein